MADGDIVIADSATEAAPHEYVVKGAEYFAIKQVQALFTDNGAGGAWLPTLEIVAPPGIVTGRYVGTSVAAGSGQEVTFFPLGSKGASGAVAESTVFGIAYRNRFNVPTTSGGTSAAFAPWDSIDSSNGDVTLNGAGELQINTAGLYYTIVCLQVVDATWTTAVALSLNYTLGIGALGNELVSTAPGWFINVTGTTAGGANHFWELTEIMYANIVTVPETLLVSANSIANAGLHVATSTFASMSAHRQGPASAGGVR